MSNPKQPWPPAPVSSPLQPPAASPRLVWAPSRHTSAVIKARLLQLERAARDAAKVNAAFARRKGDLRLASEQEQWHAELCERVEWIEAATVRGWAHDPSLFQRIKTMWKTATKFWGRSRLQAPVPKRFDEGL